MSVLYKYYTKRNDKNWNIFKIFENYILLKYFF